MADGPAHGQPLSYYLVEIENRLPADVTAAQRADLARAEAARARELGAAGVLVRLWRVAGRRANVGIWRAPSADALHAAIESLPMFPYLDIRVTALSGHPNDPAPSADGALKEDE